MKHSYENTIRDLTAFLKTSGTSSNIVQTVDNLKGLLTNYFENSSIFVFLSNHTDAFVSEMTGGVVSNQTGTAAVEMLQEKLLTQHENASEFPAVFYLNECTIEGLPHDGILLPLLEEGKVFGFLLINDESNRFDSTDLLLAETAANLLTLAVLQYNKNAVQPNIEHIRLSVLLENLQSAVLVEDEQRRIVLVNKAFCDMFSIPVPPSDLIGADCSSSAEESKHLFTDPESFVQRIDELLAIKELQTSDELHLNDGRVFDRDYIPIYLSSTYRGHLWHYRDITDHKRHEEELIRERANLLAIIENTEDIIFSVDRDCRFVTLNSVFANLFEIAFGEKPEPGMSHLELLPEENAADWHTYYQRVFQGERFSVVRNFNLAGERLSVKSTFNPIFGPGGSITGASIMARDITAEKKQIEDLEQAKLTAEESVKAKERFLAHISHEIRTPMNAILGLTHLLLKKNPSLEQEQLLKVIDLSTENLIVLLNDILDFSKMQSGNIEFINEPFHLRQLIRNIISAWEYNAQEKQLNLKKYVDIEAPDYISGDAVRLHQILLNLLANAIKYTASGEIILRVELDKSVDSVHWILFTVSDTGRGIPDSEKEHIFESFYQEKIPENKQAGSGLGLAIVKGLVENQGGSISLISQPGKGSAFTVAIPFHKVSESSNLNSEGTALFDYEKHSLNLERFVILIVEDNEINQFVIKNVLDVWNFKYDLAANGREALELIEKNDYDLVLMDLSMPVMDGYEAALYIRNHLPEQKNSIPILALTASAMLDEEDKVFKVGMNDYVTKPFKPDKLLNKILDILKKHNPGFSLSPSNSVTIADEEKTAGEKLFSLDYLYEVSRGKDAFVIEMLQKIIEKTPQLLDILTEKSLEQDWDKVRRTAHTLKPTAKYIRNKPLENLLISIEKQSGLQKGLDDIPRLIVELKKQADILLPAVENELMRLIELNSNKDISE